MEKINVQICVGTACYILGASELQHLEDYLPADIKDKVDIQGFQCLGICKNKNFGAAPYVKINNKIIANANINILIDEIHNAVLMQI